MSLHWGDNDECEFKAIKKEISLAHRRLKLLKRSSKAAGRIPALEGNIKFHSARANSISAKISELSSVTVASFSPFDAASVSYQRSIAL